MRTYRSNYIIFVALLISLIFHFIIFIFLYVGVYKSKIDRTKKDSMQLVAHKAQARQFGAPVIIQNEPKKIKEDKKKQQVKNVFQTQAESALKANTKSEVQSHIIQRTKQNVPAIKEKKRIMTGKKDHQSSRFLSNQRPIAQKKPLTLTKLAKGFLEHMQNEGTGRITTMGKEGTITAEQLKHERYIEKISACLRNSLKINRSSSPYTQIEAVLMVYLILNKNGSIKKLSIIKSSGNRLLDQFICYVFYDASSSFPPVPEYLSQSSYTITYRIGISLVDKNIGFYVS